METKTEMLQEGGRMSNIQVSKIETTHYYYKGKDDFLDYLNKLGETIESNEWNTVKVFDNVPMYEYMFVFLNKEKAVVFHLPFELITTLIHECNGEDFLKIMKESNEINKKLVSKFKDVMLGKALNSKLEKEPNVKE
jgi:hypothetical protein